MENKQSKPVKVEENIAEVILQWLQSDDVFIKDKKGNILPDAIIDCKNDSLIKLYEKLTTPKVEQGKEAEEICRWVKSSERLPDKDYSFGNDEFGQFPIRWDFENRIVIGLGYMINGQLCNALTRAPLNFDIEWLQEYKSQSLDKAIELLKDLTEQVKPLTDGYDAKFMWESLQESQKKATEFLKSLKQ